MASLRWPDFSDYAKTAADFYRTAGCSPVWLRIGAPTAQAIQLIDLLQHADLKGLTPDDYDGEQWGAAATRRLADGEAAQFDLGVTVSALRYISDLHSGKFNPGIYHRPSEPGSEKVDLTALLGMLTRTGDVRAAVKNIEPPYPGYHRTEEALARYLALMREDGEQPLPVPGKALQPGDKYPPAALLADRLSKVGDLGPEEARKVIGVYDGVLSEAVKRFQSRHGLEPDGRLGQSTMAQINTPFAVRVRQLQFTLERWRWAPHTFQTPPIVVNIPEFELRAYDNSYNPELHMKVVAGKAYGHQTPVFAADLRFVVFRPYWEVPRSIQRAEMAPKLARDRAYLQRNEYEVVTSDGKALASGPLDDATIARIRSGQLRVRQRPGAKNALGPVKFLFPNEYNVYLHGTPDTQLFARARRDFSHGCIRVERPEDLAEWLLRGIDGWTRERIHTSITGAKTVTVTLERPVPVLIVYATAVALEGGEVRFFPDIYGQDTQLAALAVKGYPRHSLTPRTDATPPASAPAGVRP
jgi:murein L,D-transpeptidase YcbB/YkuD